MSQWLWLIPCAPLLGSLIILFLGDLLRREHLAIVACCAAAIAFLVVLLAWLTGAASQPLQQTLYTWVVVGEWQPNL